MENFCNRLDDLMNDKGITTDELAQYLELSYNTIIYKWLRKEKYPGLATAIKLANFFQCTLDYLFGLSDDEITVIKTYVCPPFDLQLRKVMSLQNVSQYKLLKDKIVSRGNLNNWFNLKCNPNMESIIKLAQYFNVSLDYLVGREN